MVLRKAFFTTAAFMLAIGLGGAAMAGPERLDDQALDRVSAGFLGGLAGWFDLSEFDIDTSAINIAEAAAEGTGGGVANTWSEQFADSGPFWPFAMQNVGASSSGGSGSFASSQAFGSTSFSATRIITE